VGVADRKGGALDGTALDLHAGTEAEIAGDLGDGFGEHGAVGQFERGDGAAGVVAVLGVPDLRRRVRRPSRDAADHGRDHGNWLISPISARLGGFVAEISAGL
jgi:hypothetical protein